MNAKWVGYGVLGLAILGVVYLFRTFSPKAGEKGPAYTLGAIGNPLSAQDPNKPQSITTPVKGSVKSTFMDTVPTSNRWTGNILYQRNSMVTGNPVQTQNPIDWGTEPSPYARVEGSLLK